jgi:hypothetical protein
MTHAKLIHQSIEQSNVIILIFNNISYFTAFDQVNFHREIDSVKVISCSSSTEKIKVMTDFKDQASITSFDAASIGRYN